ncbi:MAG: DNA polymerase I [Deltaproteobacteria bacterium]
MRSLYLIDGHNVLYRTFYALPRLSAPDGTPTNAVLGTARILLKILREENPDAIAAVFDSREPTPRHALFPEYKANRLAIPEELAAQIPVVKEAIDALGVPRLEVPGVEADDVIGTLAAAAEVQGMDVVIVSSDKDLYQLVSERIRVRDGLKDRPIGVAEVRETFGVGPGQVVDLLALAGDPSDNVPGVPGIGEKTASALLREFGSLDNLLDHADRLKGARRAKIEANADIARLCRRLATIDRGVPLEVAPADLRPRGIAADRAAALFGRLGFRKLLDELRPQSGSLPLAAGGAATETPAAPAVDHARLEGAAALFAALGSGAVGRAAIDWRGGAEGPAGVSVPGAGTWVIPSGEAGEAARGFWQRGATVYVVDGKSFLKGSRAAPPEAGFPLFDVRAAGYLLAPDEGTPTLSNLFERHLRGAARAGEGDADEAAAARAEGLAALGRSLEEKLEAADLVMIFRDVDMPLVPVLAGMEEKGIGIDSAIFGELSRELAAGTAAIERKVAAIAGADFNINSPKQLGFLLFEKLGLPPVKRTKTGYSTDVDVLEQLKSLHEIPGLVLEYRTLAKVRSTYVDVLPGMADPRDGRLHTTFHLTQAATGRLSSSDPNLQNIPVRTELGRRIRSGFVAAPGCLFVGADYSQVELRLLAHLSGDAALTRGFLAGEDIHAATASGVFGVPPEEVTPELRRRAKVINFGILYGMSPFGLSRELGIGGREAKQYIDQYFDRFPGVRDYIEGVKEQARRDGFVRTILGRRRYIRDIGSRNRVIREAAERMAVNAPIQGSAADVIKIAMIGVAREYRRRGMRAELVLQVHDELIAEVPDGEAPEAGRILKEAMEGAASLSVPLTVSVSTGKNWGEIH